VTLLAPNGGESWPTGLVRTILWTASDALGVAAVRLQLSHDGGATWPETLADGLANTGAWEWQTPALPATGLRVRAVALDAAGNAGTDGSDAAFAVTDQYRPGVLLTAPAGAEGVVGRRLHHRQLVGPSTNVAVTAIDLLLSTDDGATWATPWRSGWQQRPVRLDRAPPVLPSAAACSSARAMPPATPATTRAPSSPSQPDRRRRYAGTAQRRRLSQPVQPGHHDPLLQPGRRAGGVVVFDLVGRRVRPSVGNAAGRRRLRPLGRPRQPGRPVRFGRLPRAGVRPGGTRAG